MFVSWELDREGRYSAHAWSETSMEPIWMEDRHPGFVAIADLEPDGEGRTFRWGVRLDGPAGRDRWGIVTEIGDAESQERVRELRIGPDEHGPVEATYHLSLAGRLGANPRFADHGGVPAARFAVWAPNARGR